MFHVSGIFIYPVKSLPGIPVNNAEVTPRGLKYDRRWLIIDSNNRFITQRTLPLLTQFETSISDSKITINDKRNPNSSLSFDLTIDQGTQEDVVVWKSTVKSYIADDSINDWFSKALQQEVRLAYMPDSSHRSVGEDNAGDHIVSFADSYPYLIIGESSLEHLNSKLKNKVEMQRFRPNIVFAGGEPHEEDDWSSIKIGNVKFTGVRKCGRCKVITIDQSTGNINNEAEQVLKTYRKDDKGIYFGQLLIVETSGNITIGDLLSPYN